MRNEGTFAPFVPRTAMKVILGLSVSLLLAVGIRSGRLHAANGDVLSVSTVLQGKGITDITHDTSGNPAGGSFWAASSVKLYHLSLDLGTELTNIDNPHGPGSFPNFILTWGIAYRASTDTLFVLAEEAGQWKIKEVQTNGTEVVAGAFTIQPPPQFVATAALRGLAYDSAQNELWYLDINNDKVIRTDLNGNATEVLSLPGDSPAETTLRGNGLAFDGSGAPVVYVSYGDVFQEDPSRIIQLTTTGVDTGVEVPLTLEDPLGFQTYQLGQQRRVALVLADGRIAEIEQVIPDPVPPSQLVCTLNATNQVELSWKNQRALPRDPSFEEWRPLRHD